MKIIQIESGENRKDQLLKLRWYKQKRKLRERFLRQDKVSYMRRELMSHAYIIIIVNRDYIIDTHLTLPC
jgi:hypothetical protein